jgi:hypothetical protein
MIFWESTPFVFKFLGGNEILFPWLAAFSKAEQRFRILFVKRKAASVSI